MEAEHAIELFHSETFKAPKIRHWGEGYVSFQSPDFRIARNSLHSSAITLNVSSSQDNNH